MNNLAWSKLILTDYPVYGLAVYGLARGPGHRFHINYFKLNALGSSFSFKQHLLFGRSKSKPPGSRSQAESASAGFGGGHARANPREAEIRPKVLRRGLAVDMPEQTPPKHFEPFLLPGGLLWHVPPNPDEALSPIPRLETSPSYICFEPDYGLHLGLRIRLFGAFETDSGITD